MADADELSISPSAVSHRINSLEEELGFKLFQRFHRKVTLTSEGERVFWVLKSSLEYLNQEILEIKNQELSGTLTVYSRPSIAQCWLVPKLADLAIIAAINHVGVAMVRKKLVTKRLENQELIMPFPGMEIRCEQRYYISTLSDRQWPKINAFIQWLKKMAQEN